MKRIALSILFAVATLGADITDTATAERKTEWSLSSATSELESGQVVRVAVIIKHTVSFDGDVEKVQTYNDTWTRQQLMDGGFKSANGLRVVLDLDATGPAGFRTVAVDRVRKAVIAAREAAKASAEAEATQPTAKN